MTDEQRDNLLLSMFDALNNLNEKFDKKIDNLDAKLERKFEKLSIEIEKNRQEIAKNRQEISKNRQEILHNHQEFLTKHQEVIEELERQRINVAKLENNLSDQIRALFDVKSINEDKLIEHDAMLEDINKTLNWHHGRILKLETSN